MAEKTRGGRGVDERDLPTKSRTGRAYEVDGSAVRSSPGTDRIGREAQRRATAYARARGQL